MPVRTDPSFDTVMTSELVLNRSDCEVAAYRQQANVLNLLYASLELGKGEYIRAITPMYSNYDLTVHNASAILADAGYTAKIIRKFWSPKRNGSGYTVRFIRHLPFVNYF